VTVHMLVLACCTCPVSCVPRVPSGACTTRAWSNSSEVPLRHVYGTLIVSCHCKNLHHMISQRIPVILLLVFVQ
jgi:hypothetical protein